MAAKDRWTENVKCGSCGRTGTVRWSEDDHPYMRADTRTADSHPDWVTIKNDFSTSAAAWCSICDQPTQSA